MTFSSPTQLPSLHFRHSHLHRQEEPGENTDSSVHLKPLRAMISKLWFPASPSPSEPLEGPEESVKWVKRCWSSRFLSFGSLVILTMLLVSLLVLEFHTEVLPLRLQITSPLQISGPLKPSESKPAYQALSTLSIEPDKLLPTPDKLSTQDPCKKATRRFKPKGTDSLPRGIIQDATDLNLRTLVDDPVKEAQNRPSSQSLLAMPVGFKQKETVNKIIEKFPEGGFVIMLFHYDGKVNEWNIFPWSSRAIHVAAANQTKWWFAKRFLHPDVVSPYKYIFLWDEDIGVDNFHATKYLKIVEREGLEISQPALDPRRSRIHHRITVRRTGGLVHRGIVRRQSSCLKHSSKTPCTGWVEMMVPVFSQAAWRCAWHMIQNDLILGWGLDMKLGYCAQGDSSKKVGIVDDQYVVHLGVPSLGSRSDDAGDGGTNESNADAPSSKMPKARSSSGQRAAVRRRSYEELYRFRRRWGNAVAKDKCWQGQNVNLHGE